MKEQLTLLRETAWDVLIVLDACRADYFTAVVSGQGPVVSGQCSVTSSKVHTVRSPAIHTSGWIHRVGPLFEELDVLYFTANPVVDREIRRHHFDIELVSIWKRLWGRFTEKAIPSVHPLCVNGVVAGYQEAVGAVHEPPLREGRRIVVHYIQPHCPYIGAVPLAVGRWGGAGGAAGGALGRACHDDLARPDKAVERGEMSWRLLRRAYRANLELAWHAAQQLSQMLTDRTIIVTSDHGELLGEDGRFGHEGNFGQYPEVWQVPWLELKSEGRRLKAEGNDIQEKLKALGYV